MIVKRIVPNLATQDLGEAERFYREILGLQLTMDHGWIVTLSAPGEETTPQVNVAIEGGSNTPVPSISIEVDDLDAVIARLSRAGIPIEYGPVSEPWSVRRLFVRDPAGHLLNILAHA